MVCNNNKILRVQEYHFFLILQRKWNYFYRAEWVKEYKKAQVIYVYKINYLVLTEVEWTQQSAIMDTIKESVSLII